jgi:hypothetical protein
LPGRIDPRDRREQRPAFVEAEEQRLGLRHRLPDQPPVSVQRRIDAVEPQQPRPGVPLQRGEAIFVESQVIGAVEAGAGEAGLGQNTSEAVACLSALWTRKSDPQRHR